MASFDETLPLAASELPATIIALFDDPIDAERSLQTLRKDDLAPARVSLLLQQRDATTDESVMNVARDLVAAALGALAGWLQGLAELIVTEQGRFLVAGPIGAALTGAGLLQTRSATAGAQDPDDHLHWVLTEFGFAPSEAYYVEQRLAAGSTLLAMSSPDEQELIRAKTVFHQHDAIFVSIAPTDRSFLAEVTTLLGDASTPHEAVVVADIVARLRESRPGELGADLIGRDVLAVDGEEVGEVERVLIDDQSGTVNDQIRYLVVSFGGVLGIGRRHAPVPAAAFASLTDSPVTLRKRRGALQDVPQYDTAVPLTRRDEEIIHQQLDLPPYWTAVGVAVSEGAPNV